MGPDVERLEPRVLLSGTPFIGLDDLENPGNPVVRLETALGPIDIELFPEAAPGTLASFLADVGAGRYDQSVFHRLVPGQVLEFGTFNFVEPLAGAELGFSDLYSAGYHLPPHTVHSAQRIETEDPSREALRWTVSVSEFGRRTPETSPPKAVSYTSLVFNLSDNPAASHALEFDGVTFAESRVIGRVLLGASRDVVSAIAGLGVYDLGENMQFERLAPYAGSAPGIEPFPVGGPAPRSSLVVAEDIELAKPLGSELGFDRRIFYPEGFGGRTISEFVPIANPNDEPVDYQLIARFETGDRDRVLASGTIAAGSRGGVTISWAAGGVEGLVEWGRAYALELVSTLPVAATLSHYDFSAATGESFTSDPAAAWHFADAEVDEQFHGFLVWQNTAGEDADITVEFYPEGEGEIRTFTVTTGALRRGGLNLLQLGLPHGRYGVRVTSDTSIVAALTQYDNRGGVRAGSTELGVPQTVARGGALPIARVGGSITMFNPADPRVDYIMDPTANVTVTLTPADHSREPVQRVFAVAAGQVLRYDFADAAAELGNGPFAVRFTSDNEVVFRGSRGADGDDAASPFSTVAADRWRFAEGFMDPARAGVDLFETLGVYNTMNNLTVQNEVTVTIRFADGTGISEVFSLAPSRHLLIDLHGYAPLLEQAAAGRNFYGIEVASQFPVVAQLWHDDLTLGSAAPAGGFGTIGDPSGNVMPFDGPLVIVPFG